MVIDRSGSMAETSGNGRTKLDLAKEAVYQASLGLTPRDQISLIAFDDTADAVLPLQKLPSAVEIEQALSSFNAGSGTNIRPGIEQAADTLAAANAKIKHIILMTDGIAPSNYDDLIDQLRGAGVTISTVAIGDDADTNLEDIAKRGGGRYYQVKRVEDVPKIFLQETVIIAGRDIIEGKFAPSVALQAPVVRGLNGLPALYGYNGTEIKAAARAILVTPNGKPVLAQWQYGLGRAVAWTSDFKGQWGRDWVGWDEFPRFVGGFADMLLPPRAAGTLTLRASTVGTQSALELTAQDDQGRLLNELALKGNLIDPQNQGVPLTLHAGRRRALPRQREHGNAGRVPGAGGRAGRRWPADWQHNHRPGGQLFAGIWRNARQPAAAARAGINQWRAGRSAGGGDLRSARSGGRLGARDRAAAAMAGAAALAARHWPAAPAPAAGRILPRPALHCVAARVSARPRPAPTKRWPG